MTARHVWVPEFARVYGLLPWDMSRLTLGELRALQTHHDELVRSTNG